jgi:MFS family permease
VAGFRLADARPGLQIAFGLAVFTVVVGMAPEYRVLPPFSLLTLLAGFVIPLSFGFGLTVGHRWAAALPLAFAVLLLWSGTVSGTLSTLTVLLVGVGGVLAGAISSKWLEVRRMRSRRLFWPPAPILIGAPLLALGLAPAVWAAYLGQHPLEQRPGRPLLVDARVASYRGVGLGDSRKAAEKVFGPPEAHSSRVIRLPGGAAEAGAPLRIPRTLTPRSPTPPIAYRYADGTAVLFAGGRVEALVITSSSAETARGVGVGDALAKVRQAYPHAYCAGQRAASSVLGVPYCTVPLEGGRSLRFGQDPVASITVASPPLLP